MVKKRENSSKQLFIFLAIAVIIVIALVIIAVGVEKENIVKRNFQASAKPGEIITIRLDVNVKGLDTYYALEEYVPVGFTVIDKGQGESADPKILKWVVFQDAKNTHYTYTVKVPEQEGNYAFDGIYMFNDQTQPSSIKGATTIKVSS